MIVIVIVLVLFSVLIGWTWTNLYNIEKNKKILYISIGIAIISFITFILFYISKSNVKYPNNDMIKYVRNALVFTFAPINGMIVMPYIAKKISSIKEKKINENQLKKRLIIILVFFIIALIIECSYMKNTQIGILKLMENTQ